jgi:flagellar hook-basal body complex protein FliE
MTAPILPVSSVGIPEIRPAAESNGGGSAFQDVFASAVQKVESMGQEATVSVERFLSGEGEELHTAVLATQRAELAFEMFLQTRNKVVSAYQEIMRMQM